MSNFKLTPLSQTPPKAFRSVAKTFVFVWVRRVNGAECSTVPHTELWFTRVYMWG